MKPTTSGSTFASPKKHNIRPSSSHARLSPAPLRRHSKKKERSTQHGSRSRNRNATVAHELVDVTSSFGATRTSNTHLARPRSSGGFKNGHPRKASTSSTSRSMLKAMSASSLTHTDVREGPLGHNSLMSLLWADNPRLADLGGVGGLGGLNGQDTEYTSAGGPRVLDYDCLQNYSQQIPVPTVESWNT